MASIQRGDIFYADLSPVIGSEQGGIRPVLIVQNDIGNAHSPTTIIAVITSKPTKAKMALSKLKQIERMDIVDRPNRYDTRSFTKNFKLKETSGKLVLKTEELKFGYKEPLGVTSFELFRGDTLGIIGANGIIVLNILQNK